MILFSLYIIVSTTLLVQSLHSAGRINFQSLENPPRGYQRNAFPQSKDSTHINRYKSPIGADEVKNLFDRLLEEIAPATKDEKRAAAPDKENAQFKHIPDRRREQKSKKCANTPPSREPEWAKWTDWSSCSVTCGKGRQIRWRHCLQNCDGVETEMEEKTCQLPACGGKLFGLINL